MRSRSNSASAARIWSCNFPAGVVQSIQLSAYTDARWRYVAPTLRQSWDSNARAIVADLKPSRETAPVWRSVLGLYADLTAQAHRAGVQILAGQADRARQTRPQSTLTTGD
jgi:hypothetical protein